MVDVPRRIIFEETKKPHGLLAQSVRLDPNISTRTTTAKV